MFFDCLAMFYYKKQELKGEAMGLQLFLEKYHRIFYFHLLAKSIRGSLFNRELKGNKIYIAKRHRYFNFFQATMRDRRIAKLIKIKQIKMA